MVKSKKSEPPEEAAEIPVREWTDRHLWQIVPIRDLLIALGCVGFFLLGARLSIVTVPFLVALMLAYLFEPTLRHLERVRYLTRQSAAALVATIACIIIGGVLVVGLGFAAVQSARLLASVTGRASDVIASLKKPDDPALREKIGTGGWLEIHDFILDLREPENAASDGVRSVVSYLGVDRKDVSAAVDQIFTLFEENSGAVAQQAIETGGNAVGSAVSFAGLVGQFAFEAFLTLFFFFFLATEWRSFAKFLRSTLPEANRERMLELGGKMDHAISGFIRGRLTIALILAVFYTIGFGFMGVPAALLLGGAIAVLALIPYAVIAGIPIVIALLWLEAQSGFRGEWWFVVLAPIGWYQIGQVLDDYVLTPMIQGKATDLATPEIVFASIAAGSLFGVFGLLVAIPLAACLKIILKEVVWPRYRAYCERTVEEPEPVKTK